MAKMIPAEIYDSKVSSAERRVFNLLDKDPDTDGWRVLHSVGLARRPTGPYGEIDFVVMIPREGILCLEVKGGRVSCEEGEWRTMDRHGNLATLKKSPFMQARDSMFALRNMVVDHFGSRSSESDCPIGSAVVFPDVVCPPVTPEIERSDVIDSEDLRRPISASIGRVVRNRLRGLQPRSGEKRPTPSELKAILAYLRPNFDLVPAKSVSLGRTEAELMSLTEEQYDRLDELESNPRCLFEGAAGTGKTLLAIEYAKRAARADKRVLFVCFNRLLGAWLQQQTKGTGITTGNWHEILEEIIVSSSDGEEFLAEQRKVFEGKASTDADYTRLFEEVYPFYGEMALDEMETQFDVLVMDEAQDLFDKDTLDLMNRAVRGGLAGSTWGIFGDFTRQAIYASSSGSLADLSGYCEHFVRSKLSINCRTTRRIAEEASIIGGFDAPPLKRGYETGMPVERRYWGTPCDLVESLAETIRRLVNGGVTVDEMMVLSPRRLENSALAGVEQIGGVPLVGCSRSLDAGQGCIRFSTIHSFKGMERQVVIIVDVNAVDDERSQSLLYVGMSRARSLLILMINEQARGAFEARIRSAR